MLIARMMLLEIFCAAEFCQDDQTALHIACSTGGVKSITLLLNAGANLESRDRVNISLHLGVIVIV